MKKIARITFVVLTLVSLCGCAIPGSLEKTGTVRQLERLAEKGDAESQYQLGLLYTLDSRWFMDHIRGYRWFYTAAEQGHSEAQYMVGLAKLNASGTLLDRNGAAQFFQRSAIQGHARAQYQLGVAYLNGTGVRQDKAWGRQWLEQAAWSGHKEASFMLGALFSGGIGGQENTAEAWRWLKRATDLKHPLAATALDKLSARMSGEALAHGKRLLAQKLPGESSPYLLPRIRFVQTALNELGYSAGDEDGVVGQQTLSAAESFVLKNKLPHETRVERLAEPLHSRLTVKHSR